MKLNGTGGGIICCVCKKHWDVAPPDRDSLAFGGKDWTCPDCMHLDDINHYMRKCSALATEISDLNSYICTLQERLESHERSSRNLCAYAMGEADRSIPMSGTDVKVRDILDELWQQNGKLWAERNRSAIGAKTYHNPRQG